MRTIVITGCSTGFGRVTAGYLAARGWRVLAVVRREEQRAELLSEAATNGWQDRLLPVRCDITQPEDVQGLAPAVAELGAGLDALLNNAGTAYAGPLELLSLDDVRAQLEINVVAHLAVTQALLPLLKSAGGVVMNVSSVGGRMAFPLYGPYHMSKFALEAMTEVLRLEMAHFGVRVVTLVPGASPTAIWETGFRRVYSTPFYAHLGEYAALGRDMEKRARATAAGGFPPELFARTVLRILDSRRPAPVYYIPRSAGLIVAARRLVPDRLWYWAVRRILRW